MTEINYAGILAVCIIAGLITGFCFLVIQSIFLSYQVADLKSQLRNISVSCYFEPFEGATKIILGETTYYCVVS